VKNFNLGTSVRFLGQVPHKEMPNLLAQTDIYVSTSLFDGTSVSLLEAMASGAFPIVTDIPANREWIIDGENGFLIQKEDDNLLAKKILEAIRDDKLLGKAFEKNRNIIGQKAYWKENIKRVKALYQKAL
jgi:glycosyltransferase involved in cell wall biosynthesis